MPTTKRAHAHPSVIQRLLDEPYRFQFYQAVRLLETCLRQHGVAREDALAAYLRFDNSVSLAFPASEIEALSVQAEGAINTDAALSAALRDKTLRHIRITPAFMGLLGNGGALPHHYSERIGDQLYNEKNDCPRAFLDTYSNRALALSYRAWGKYRQECMLDAGGNDAFLPLALALGGFRPAARGDAETGVSDATLAYYAGALRQRPVSATVMARVLSDYFQVPFALEEFVGCWHELGVDKQMRFGGPNAAIGRAIAGHRVWRHDLRARIRIGPLDRAGYERFLPGADAARALRQLLAAFAGPPLRYEIHPILRAGAVQPLQAAPGDAPWGRRIGYDAFVCATPAAADRDDMFYDLAP